MHHVLLLCCNNLIYVQFNLPPVPVRCFRQDKFDLSRIDMMFRNCEIRIGALVVVIVPVDTAVPDTALVDLDLYPHDPRTAGRTGVLRDQSTQQHIVSDIAGSIKFIVIVCFRSKFFFVVAFQMLLCTSYS
jgi:hypothetical protein